MEEEPSISARIILARTFLNIQHTLKTEGIEPELTIIVMAVELGTLEGQEMDVSTLSNICVLPRPTVIRYLDRLEAMGVVYRRRVGRRSIVSLSTGGEGLESQFWTHLREHLSRACRQLSRMDT